MGVEGVFDLLNGVMLQTNRVLEGSIATSPTEIPDEPIMRHDVTALSFGEIRWDLRPINYGTTVAKMCISIGKAWAIQ